MTTGSVQGIELVRPLGHIEVYSASRHALGLYNGIANCCRYAVSKAVLEAAPALQLFENALAQTILRLSSLRVGIIQDDTDEPHFVHIPSINMQEIIEWKSVSIALVSDPGFDQALSTIIEDRLNQVWTEMKVRPPWKLLVIQESRDASPGHENTVVFEVIFATHHSLADGKSTSLVHKVLLEELNRAAGPPSELKNHVLTLKEVPVLAPSQEDLVKFKTSWLFLLRRLWDEFGPAWLKPAPLAKPWGGKPITLEPRELHIRVVTISPSVLSSLLAACRAQKATLTSLLHALVLTSISHRVPAGVAAAFKAGTAMSLQPFATFPPGEEVDFSKVMTDMNTSTPHHFGPELLAQLRAIDSSAMASNENPESEIWQLATKLRADIKKKLENLPNDDVAGLLAWVSDWRQRWLKKIGQHREETWVLSNIGSLDYNTAVNINDKDEVGSWRIERSIFSQPAAVVGPAFSVNVAGVTGGPVTICFDWQEGIVDAEVMNGIANGISANLDSFQRTGRFGFAK